MTFYRKIEGNPAAILKTDTYFRNGLYAGIREIVIRITIILRPNTNISHVAGNIGIYLTIVDKIPFWENACE